MERENYIPARRQRRTSCLKNEAHTKNIPQHSYTVKHGYVFRSDEAILFFIRLLFFNCFQIEYKCSNLKVYRLLCSISALGKENVINHAPRFVSADAMLVRLY